MQISFLKDELLDFKEAVHKEWVLTNGIGGYAGSSIIGAHNRTHQGYLIASLHPPVERYLVFSKTNEQFFTEKTSYNLETSQHAGQTLNQKAVVSEEEVPDAYKAAGAAFVASDFSARRPVYSEGQRYLEAFTYNGCISFQYQAGLLSMTKQITLVSGENTCAVAYEVSNQGEDAVFTITPLMNYREHSLSSTKESLQFQTHLRENGFDLIPESNPEITISVAISEGTLHSRKECFDLDMQLQTEVELETPGLDSHYCPYDIRIFVPAHSAKRISLLCQVLSTKTGRHRPVSSETAFSFIQMKQQAVQKLIETAGYHDDFANTLVLASNQFLSFRASTGLTTVLAGLPWFTDWGRDTMIAFSGLTLSTKRFAEAREILKTFAQYVKHGLVPNMFPDNGQEPLYNTADASLWYFYAVYQYLSYTGSTKDYAFIQQEIYAALKEIYAAYCNGTDFSIHMDDDGLICAGSGTDQVTWMDVRVGDWVVTPRHGKPVEINALWYNAVKILENLAEHFGEETKSYHDLSIRIKDSFCRKFWNPAAGCLYDVIDGDNRDSKIRPNQIYAVSLPYTMLNPEQEKAIVAIVKEKLYTGCGLRSLAPEDPDYHPVYCGSLPKRDAAYHQGTSWGYLLGAFISAYMKVHGHTARTAAEALALLSPVKEHLRKGCIGSISEIFDGNAPHTCRGCYAQAWSVGEILRCYTEDVFPVTIHS